MGFGEGRTLQEGYPGLRRVLTAWTAFSPLITFNAACVRKPHGMSITIQASIDEDLLRKLGERLSFGPDAEVRIEVAEHDGEDLVWVVVQEPNKKAPRRMSLAQALQPEAAAETPSSVAPPVLRGRPIPASVLAISGVVEGSGEDAEAEYKRHVLTKHSR